MKQLKIKITTIYKTYTGVFLPFLLSVFLLLGNSYQREGSWALCFGSLKQFVLFLLLLCISFVTIKFILGLCFIGLDFLKGVSAVHKTQPPSVHYGFLQKHTLLKVMGIVLLCWLPYLAGAFPGFLCIDSQTQLNQIYGYSAYSLHHPMLHTLLMGVCVRGGQALFGSANLGLFIYIFLQAIFLAFALALSIWAMCYKKTSRLWVFITLALYCFTPLFGYYASLAIKDTPFNSAFLIFMICFLLLWEKAPFKFLPYLFVVNATLVCQFRNNGIYLVGFMALLILFLLTKHKVWRECLCKLFLPIIGAIVLHLLLNLGIAYLFQPQEGYSREMLSIFMQQTARYTATYSQDITAEELSVLENIFGSTKALAENYNPHLSDPVKNMFKMDASSSEILEYLKVWFSQFWRHPDAYFEAFFHGAYGWFYPFVDNAAKYYDPGFIFTKPAITTSIDNVVTWWYDAFRNIPVLNLLQSIGFYTWLMFISISYVWHRGQRQKLFYFAPLLLSLLICLAAPAFFQHARYGFPILFCMPLLIGFITSAECPDCK